jgi:predicted 3-demethylubiquinone-9 3-methyltransferase (glyoxalase superfamily)
MSKISPCLWFDGKAEEAANFYVSLFGDGSIDAISRYPEHNPTPAPFAPGQVLVVEFTLFGQSYQALNGGPEFLANEAVSLAVGCRDQAEVDRYFEALTADGGSPAPCGWVKDKYGFSWQLQPDAIMAMHRSGDAVAVARMMDAMMTMQKLDIAVLTAAFEGETV